MIISFNRTYRLKEGAIPALGRADYGTTDLVPLAFDSDDMTVEVKPAGFVGGKFWALITDIEEE